MEKSEPARETAHAFAAALDREDYIAARVLMAPGCRYEIRDETLRGPEAIIASYRGNGDSARDRFEKIEYESRVEALGEDTARIDFTDIVTFKEQTHTFRCRQHLTIDENGLIIDIRHEDFPGERERLAEFLRVSDAK